jgi:hypothetical protein
MACRGTRGMVVFMVRAKFVVDKIGKTRYGYGEIKLSPVCDSSWENKQFWQATPSGEITLNVTNSAALENFEIGKAYYVDFTEAEKV